MKKTKNNKTTLFIISVLVIIIGGLISIAVYEKNQEKEILKSLPTQAQIDAINVGEINDFNLSNQPVLGDKEASVEVVLFGDFKCPACAQWKALVFNDLKETYIETGKVKFHFMNYQFLGPDSWFAGSAGEAIYHQNPEAFWQYYDAISENQGISSTIWANEKFLISLVKEHVTGIDQALFEKDLREHTYLKNVKEDVEIGKKFGVMGTPSVYVNGVKVDNPSFPVLQSVIESALSEDTK